MVSRLTEARAISHLGHFANVQTDFTLEERKLLDASYEADSRGDETEYERLQDMVGKSMMERTSFSASMKRAFKRKSK